MQEVEAKFYVRDLDKISARLQDLGASLLEPRVFETNIRFDLPGRRLRSEGRVLRLRRDTKARLTYKGPSTNEQGVLSRVEIEFIVEDFEKAKAFLEALGYQELISYEKYRTTYALAQTSEGQADNESLAHIMLDELPYGNFVEIEGATVEAIRTITNHLKLKWEAAIPTSYHALFERLCARHPQLNRTQLIFTALNGLEIGPEDLSVRAADG